MALMRDQEKTPAAIAARLRLGQQQTSSLLKRLTEGHHLRSIPHPKDKRSRLYTLREGFFDIWLAMDRSAGAREGLAALLDFFSDYYGGRVGRAAGATGGDPRALAEKSRVGRTIGPVIWKRSPEGNADERPTG